MRTFLTSPGTSLIDYSKAFASERRTDYSSEVIVSPNGLGTTMAASLAKAWAASNAAFFYLSSFSAYSLKRSSFSFINCSCCSLILRCSCSYNLLLSSSSYYLLICSNFRTSSSFYYWSFFSSNCLWLSSIWSWIAFSSRAISSFIFSCFRISSLDTSIKADW